MANSFFWPEYTFKRPWLSFVAKLGQNTHSLDNKNAAKYCDLLYSVRLFLV